MMWRLKDKLGQKGYTLMEVLIVATIVGILVTIGTVQYLEVKRRSKERLAAGKLSQLAACERMYYRDFGNYATFDELREVGLINYDYIYEDDELQHYHRPAYIPEYKLDFNIDTENNGFQIVAEPVLDEAHLWYPRWVGLGGINDLRSLYVNQDGVVMWLDTNQAVY